MSEELKALQDEYSQHWEHCRHGVDKQYQAFNFYLVTVAILVSALSFSADNSPLESSSLVFLAIGLVVFLLSAGSLMLLISQRNGYALHYHVIISIRQRISVLSNNSLNPEKDLFRAPSVFGLTSAAACRNYFVSLIGSVVIGLCTYLYAVSIPANGLDGAPLGFHSFCLSLLVFLTLTIGEAYRRTMDLEKQLSQYDSMEANHSAFIAILCILFIVWVMITIGPLIIPDLDFYALVALIAGLELVIAGGIMATTVLVCLLQQFRKRGIETRPRPSN